MRFKNFFIFLLCILLYKSNAYSQFSLLVGPGIASYAGDVSFGGKIEEFRPKLNVELWYQMNRHLYLKSGFNLYQLYAEDFRSQRNRDFRASNFEVYTSLMYSLNSEWRIMPFAFLGLGVSTNSPQYAIPTNNGGKRYIDAKTLNTEGENIPGSFVVIPGGIGFRFRVNYNIAIVTDGGFRYANTDLIDGVSVSSINTSNLSQEAIDYFEAIREENLSDDIFIGNGSPAFFDFYGMIAIKLQIRLNDNYEKVVCPPFFNR